MKDIYTVIIIKRSGGDLSTASFVEFDDAVEYCIGEMKSNGSDVDETYAISELNEQMYYDDRDTEYYIEEANLIG